MPHADYLTYQPPHDLLAGRVILVTGATEGIGKVAALSYARLGAKVLLLGRNQQKLQQVQQAISVATASTPAYFLLDLLQADEDSCQQLAAAIAAQFPRLDGVLHNAGLLGTITPLLATQPATWRSVLQVNLNATFYLTCALKPLLEASTNCSVVLTSSSVGRRGRAGWGSYAITKFATEAMMQVLAAEYPAHKIRFNCINPGATRTGMRASAFPAEDAQTLLTPEQIMPLYQWLMGSASNGITGQSFDAQPNRKPGKGS